MQNTRHFCDEPENEHVLVPPIVEVRDHLGTLAVQILAAREDLATIDPNEAVRKLYDIVEELHDAYKKERVRIPY